MGQREQAILAGAVVVDLDPQGSAAVLSDLRQADQPVVVSAHRQCANPATGSPTGAPGCDRSRQTAYWAASPANRLHVALPRGGQGRRNREAHHQALGAGRPRGRIDAARRTRAGYGQGGRVEVVTDGCPLRGGRRSRAGRRRYLPVAGAAPALRALQCRYRIVSGFRGSVGLAVRTLGERSQSAAQLLMVWHPVSGP